MIPYGHMLICYAHVLIDVNVQHKLHHDTPVCLPDGMRDTFRTYLMNGFLFMALSVKDWDMRRKIAW